MTEQQIKKGKELLDELNELEYIEKLLSLSAGHFEAKEHYNKETATGKCIPRRYNDRILSVVKEIIVEIKSEIQKL